MLWITGATNVGPSYAWGPGLMSSSGATSGSVGMFRDPLLCQVLGAKMEKT